MTTENLQIKTHTQCTVILLTSAMVLLSGCHWPGIDNHKHSHKISELPQQTVPELPLVEKVRKRDGTNFLGVYMGMIAEWDGDTYRYHPPTDYLGGIRFADKGWMETNAHPQGVMMFSATSGELLKWISYEDFRDIFVLKVKSEYSK